MRTDLLPTDYHCDIGQCLLIGWGMTSAISEDQNKRLVDLYKGELSIFRDT